MRVGIVGAGVAGMVSALMLARTGIAVTLYEKDTPAAGASGKALGVLVPSTLQRPIDALQREGIARWPALAATLEEITGAPRETFWREWPRPERPGCQQVRLPFLFDVLKQALDTLGVPIEQREISTPALDDLAHVYDYVLLAAGYGNKALSPLPLTLSAGQAIKVHPTQPLKDLILVDNLYICPDWDGTVRIGSISWDTEEDGVIAAAPDVTTDLLSRATRHVPVLEGASVIAAWVGARPVSVPRVPLLHPVPPYNTVWAVAGLGKIGVGLSPMVAQYLLDICNAPHA